MFVLRLFYEKFASVYEKPTFTFIVSLTLFKMAAKCVIAVAILIVVINSIESKSVSIPEEDETVNINIKNGAGLKISYPAGEIIVPSERKNVRIKTIDVFEEKNSPPVGPEPKETDRSVLKYPYCKL